MMKMAEPHAALCCKAVGFARPSFCGNLIPSGFNAGLDSWRIEILRMETSRPGFQPAVLLNNTCLLVKKQQHTSAYVVSFS